MKGLRTKSGLSSDFAVWVDCVKGAVRFSALFFRKFSQVEKINLFFSNGHHFDEFVIRSLKNWNHCQL